MRRKLLIILIFGLTCLLIELMFSEALCAGQYVAVFKIDGPINHISARYLARCIDEAEVDEARLAVIKLYTPGGLLSSTRNMVKEIFDAKIPVAVYVYPPGAHAASAGTFITAAANFAVMAPSTNIGAASPVTSKGEDLPETMKKKVQEDIKAFIRGIAAKRGRNAQALEETVTKALSYSAEEAVEKGVVDFIARDLSDLLYQLDNKTTETAAGTVTLHTREASIVEIKMTLLERFLQVLAKPNIAFILLTIGQYGIFAELIVPGFIGPGVVGVICLVLAFVGLGNLPVNLVAAGLLLFSMFLFFMELQQPGIGIFGIGGLISFVLGAFFLFGDFGTPHIPKPVFRVSIWLIAVIAGILCAFLLSLIFLIRSGTKTRAQIGVPRAMRALVGQSGMVVSALSPSGTIRIEDQSWTATTTSDDLITEGEEVIVIGVYGRVLKVSKVTKES